MMDSKDYQNNYSEQSPAMFDVAERQKKARTMVAVLEDYLRKPISQMRVLNDGGSTGIIDEYLSRFAGSVTGIDIDQNAISHAKENFVSGNLSFQVADALALPFSDQEFDIVISSQVYEHVTDPAKMMSEIFRVLKPGGICYFAAGNRLCWNEPHYHLPLLSVLPKSLAHLYLKISKRGEYYYETHFTYWGLKKLTRAFHVHDYTRPIIENPKKFFADYMIRPGTKAANLAQFIAKHAIWIMPGYVWVLKKPEPSV